MKKKLFLFYIILINLVFLDQITKFLIIKYLTINNSIILIRNFLKFYYIKNTGISFGMLGGKQLLIIIITFIIIAYLIYDLTKNINNKKSFISTMLIVSGALGNLIDRVFRGYVVDFISFTLFGKEMAIFNVADVLITFGVIIYIYNLIVEGKHGKNSN